jgi:hypothetical protein
MYTNIKWCNNTLYTICFALWSFSWTIVLHISGVTLCNMSNCFLHVSVNCNSRAYFIWKKCNVFNEIWYRELSHRKPTLYLLSKSRSLLTQSAEDGYEHTTVPLTLGIGAYMLHKVTPDMCVKQLCRKQLDNISWDFWRFIL